MRSSPSRPTAGARAVSPPKAGCRRWAASRLVALLLLLLLTAPTAGRTQALRESSAGATSGAGRYDPRLRFRTISTDRFTLYFHQGEEALASRLAVLVEEVAADVDRRLGPPRGRVHVVLVDQTDQSNGWATVLPYNLIELAAVPPVSQSAIGNTDDWLRMVFAHEYTHVVHLERGGGWIGGLRRVFGRMPLLYPNAFLPDWQVEGLATYVESAVTGQGRVPAGDFRLLLDAAAASDRFLTLDRAGGGLIDWPSGQAPYLYGAYFHEYLAGRYGQESLRRLADRTAGTLPYFGARAFRHVFGRSLGALWADFEADARSRLDAEAAPRQSRRITSHGFNVGAPAFSRDGRLFYSVASPHGFPALMEQPRDGSTPRRIGPRYQGERIATAGDDLVFDQLEVVHHADLQSDLFAVSLRDGAVRRLTHEARAADPDVSPDGRTIVCTVQQTGRRVLAAMEVPVLGQKGTPVVRVSEVATEFSWPRWSPDGRVIAAERRRLGGPSDIVLIDAASSAVRTLVAGGRERNTTPAWLPDGSGVLFASDRDGAFQIHVAEVATGSVRRLLGTGPGARAPAVSPDGRQLAFVGYAADGYDVYALPFESAAWVDVPPAVLPVQTDAPPPAEIGASVDAGGAQSASPPSAVYRPWSTLAPRYWSPIVESRQDNLLVGATTSGFDALGRHAYIATARWAVPGNHPEWQMDYAYARWWPTIFASAADTLEDWRTGEVRTREISSGVLLPFRRVRWSSTAFAGVHAARDAFSCADCTPPIADAVLRRDLRFGWHASTARAFGYSIGAEEGAAVSLTSELTPASSGATAAGAMTVDGRSYWRVIPRHGVIAARVAGASAWGDRHRRRVFEAAGAGPQPSGFDFGSGAVGLLRGFRAADLFGQHAAVVNLDYRFPLGWPQRGLGTLPLMARSIHGAVFADVGHAWDGAFRAADVRRSFGVELSADTVIGYALPLTVTAGAAWRDDPSGRRRGWAAFARAGRAF